MDGLQDQTVCPYFQGRDERCARRFNLQSLPDVFDECLGDYPSCRHYHQLSVVQRHEEPRRVVETAA